LVIDPKAQLPRTIASQSFEPIAGRAPQFLNGDRRVQDEELAEGNRLDLAWKAAGNHSAKDPFGFPVAERLDHVPA